MAGVGLKGGIGGVGFRGESGGGGLSASTGDTRLRIHLPVSSVNCGFTVAVTCVKTDILLFNVNSPSDSGSDFIVWTMNISVFVNSFIAVLLTFFYSNEVGIAGAIANNSDE